MKIGNKIGLVLGATVLLLTGLSALSLWGSRTNGRLAVTLTERLTKARLAESIRGDTSAITMNLAKMVLSGKKINENANRILDLRKNRIGALEQFRALADSPVSIKHATELGEMVQSQASANDRIVSDLASGRVMDASKDFRVAFTIAETVYAKAKEASQYQVQRADEAEQERKATANEIWIALTAGSLLAIAGRHHRRPHSGARHRAAAHRA